MRGYKAFYKDLQNQYGEKYELNTVYEVQPPLKWQENGFHFCANLEDTLRYYDCINEDVVICKITAKGEVLHRFDEYNEYHVFVCSKMIINNILSREEIIQYASKLAGFPLERFIKGYNLSEEEIDMLLENDPHIKQRIRK